MELVNHIEIPEIGLGVYKMEAGAEMNEAIGNAYQYGYRLFDTAQMYKNEEALGDALKENHIQRETVFLNSKVDNCNQGYEKTISSFHDSLKRLQTDYLDSFLIHWPGLNKERTLSTWKALEELYKAGLIRAIGVSNFEISQLEILLENCEIPPMINQIEHTPFLHDEQLNSFCKKNKIQIMAWGPLLRGKMEDDGIKEIASRYAKSPAQLLLRWNIQQGIIPIPKTKNSSRLIENISVFDFQIEPEDMAKLNAMNENMSRLIDAYNQVANRLGDEVYPNDYIISLAEKFDKNQQITELPLDMTESYLDAQTDNTNFMVIKKLRELIWHRHHPPLHHF